MMPRIDIATRFWAKVRIPDDRAECWEWTAGTDAYGYGRFFSDHQDRAHVWSYRHHAGPIPSGLHVMHRCDNPPCVNPAHLSLGHPIDNVADKCSKGRQIAGDRHYSKSRVMPRGADHVNSTLSDNVVREMRAAYLAGGISQRVLAARYGISQGYASTVLTRKRREYVI